PLLDALPILRIRVDDDRSLQAVDPPAGERCDRPIGLQPSVVGNREQTFDEVAVDPLDRGPERLLVSDPRVLVPGVAPDRLERMPRPSPVELRVMQSLQLATVAQPPSELGG